MSALKKAVELAGGASELSRKLGAPFPSRVTNWLLPGRLVPAEECEKIEAITGVTCEELRADLDWARVDGRVFYRERDKSTTLRPDVFGDRQVDQQRAA